MSPIREQVRSLALEHGRAACSAQLLDPPWQHWVAADGRAAIAYTVQGRSWIAGGAPLAAATDVAATASAFARDAARRGARVLWFLAEEPLRAAVGAGAWLRIGAQPVFSPESLCREFARRRSLRQQLRRTVGKRLAVREWRNGDDGDRAEFAACHATWRAGHRAPLLRLLAGGDAPDDLRDRRLFVARRDGRVVGYLSLLPIAARNGWLVEQIVRGDGCSNGTPELLLHAAAQTLRDEGAAMLTLGCAPLSRRGAPSAAATIRVLDRACALVRRLGRSVYDFAGLEAFKQKFAPDAWEPLWLGSPSDALSLRDLLVVARAEAGGSVLRFAGRALARRLASRGR